MAQKDYIERAIEAFARIVASVRHRTAAGGFAEAEALLQRAAETYIGLSLKVLEPCSYEGLRSLLRIGGSLDDERCLMLADLRVLEGDLRLAEGHPPLAANSYTTALRLYMEAVNERGLGVLDGHLESADTAARFLQARGLETDAKAVLSLYLTRRSGRPVPDETEGK